jgi:beta-galactosidase
VFGREAGGFGIVGSDGGAEERVVALTETAGLLREHEALLDGYGPDPARAAVVFDGTNHQLEWAFSGVEGSQSGGSVLGYLLCLERLQVPYDVLEASHLAALEGYGVIFMPWPMIVREELASALEGWVRAGGTLVVESELDAYDERGLYRYPGERPFPRSLGFTAAGRRPVDEGEALRFELDGVSGQLRPASWLDPLIGEGDAIAASAAGTIILRRQHGQGILVAVGTHAGLAYRHEPYQDFERFIRVLLEKGGGLPELECSIRDGELVQWRTGRSGKRRLIFISNAGPAVQATLTGPAGFFNGATSAADLISGHQSQIVTDGTTATLHLTLNENSSSVVAF